MAPVTFCASVESVNSESEKVGMQMGSEPSSRDKHNGCPGIPLSPRDQISRSLFTSIEGRQQEDKQSLCAAHVQVHSQVSTQLMSLHPHDGTQVEVVLFPFHNT